MNLQLEIFEGLNAFGENAYLVHNGTRAHLFDPGFSNDYEWGLLIGKIKELKVIPEAIVLTHAHIDHILGLQRAQELFNAPVYMHEDGLPLMDHFDEQAMMFGLEADPITVEPFPILPSNAARIESFEYDIRHTPGHAPGHVSFYHQPGGWVIVGDTLFAGGVGRTDLYGGDFGLLEESIRKKLYVLPDETVVWPGHGHQTTIGYEKKSNPFVRSAL
ncbi:MBL fold metallo-hydrolase [Balneolaceae bacterium ANBcel3]|nr:MBL fold metallo-hydrolase [Balneolaceae bacterium ANBcel3]